jgi:hypothetical protein
MTTKTLAEEFCADLDAWAYDAPFFAEDTYSWDAGTRGGAPTSELRFADGSFACSVEGGEYEPRQLREDEKLPELAAEFAAAAARAAAAAAQAVEAARAGNDRIEANNASLKAAAERLSR